MFPPSIGEQVHASGTALTGAPRFGAAGTARKVDTGGGTGGTVDAVAHEAGGLFDRVERWGERWDEFCCGSFEKWCGGCADGRGRKDDFDALLLLLLLLLWDGDAYAL